MNDLKEARLALENPIEVSFDVHLSNFMERCVFLATNNDTVSPVKMICTLTKSIKNFPVFDSLELRFNEFFPLPVQRTSANVVGRVSTGVRNLTSKDAGRGGRGGRGGRASTKYCWFHGYKGYNGTECRNADLTSAQKNAKKHSEVAGGCLQSTI